MLTNRFKALEDAIAQLPPDVQDKLAEALEDALRQATITAPLAAPEVRAAIDRALERHAASVQYLQDK